MIDKELLKEIRFSSCADQLKPVRCQIRSIIENMGFEKDQLCCIILAVNEACMNIVQHAYGNQSNGEIILEIYNDPRQITFRLIDFAPPVDACTIKSRDLDDIRPGGLGVHLIREVMDEVEYLNDPEGIGNILIMKKNK